MESHPRVKGKEYWMLNVWSLNSSSSKNFNMKCRTGLSFLFVSKVGEMGAIGGDMYHKMYCSFYKYKDLVWWNNTIIINWNSLQLVCHFYIIRVVFTGVLSEKYSNTKKYKTFPLIFVHRKMLTAFHWAWC